MSSPLSSTPEPGATPADPAAGGATTPSSGTTSHFEHCPICGHRLVGRTCQLFCSNDECHYFQSCSDID